MEIEGALNTKQAAKFLGLSPGTLAVWRSRASGPPFRYSGAKPVYYASELRDWQRQCTDAHLPATQKPCSENTEVTA